MATLEPVYAALTSIMAGAVPADEETTTLDFKEDKGSRHDLEISIAKAAICFANSAGGSIVVGVADRRTGEEAITGTEINAETLRKRIWELTEPPLLVDVEVFRSAARLLIVSVRSSSTVHADKQGRSYHRVNRDCIPLSPIQQARLAQERVGFDWSAQASTAKIEDLSKDAIELARELLRALQDDRRYLASRTSIDLLRSLGLYADGDRLNEAGKLLLCSPSDNDLVVYQHKTTPGGEPRTVRRFRQPLLVAFRQVMDLVSARQSTTPVAMPNGQQITIEDFPSIAVREALSNAFCHRDWQVNGPITVDHSPEVFIVTSPGPLVQGITIENILTMPSRPRNRCLAAAVRLLGMAEETGRGVDRMFRETIRSGRQPPLIEALPDQVRISFVGGAPDTNIARFVARLPDDEREDTDTMLLLYTLCRKQTVTAFQVSPLLQKTAIECNAVLRRLCSEPASLLEVTRQSAGRSKAVFRLRGTVIQGLGAAVIYNRRTVDETDRKVIEHIREYGKITNRTIQNFFDVHVFRARDVISSLQQRGILARISTKARGPGVEWGAGPNFPKARRPRKIANRENSNQEELEGGQSDLPFDKRMI